MSEDERKFIDVIETEWLYMVVYNPAKDRYIAVRHKGGHSPMDNPYFAKETHSQEDALAKIEEWQKEEMADALKTSTIGFKDECRRLRHRLNNITKEAEGKQDP